MGLATVYLVLVLNWYVTQYMCLLLQLYIQSMTHYSPNDRANSRPTCGSPPTAVPVPVLYLKLGHSCFLPHCAQFGIQ